MIQLPSNTFLSISQVEVEQMMLRDNVDLSQMSSTPLDLELSSGSTITSHEGSSSGGYAEYIFKTAAKELFNKNPNNLSWKTLR